MSPRARVARALLLSSFAVAGCGDAPVAAEDAGDASSDASSDAADAQRRDTDEADVGAQVPHYGAPGCDLSNVPTSGGNAASIAGAMAAIAALRRSTGVRRRRRE